MRIKLAYGKNGLGIEIPDAMGAAVVQPCFVPAHSDERAAIVASLRDPIGSPPLRELVRSNDRVGIVFSDITRPTPNHLIVPAILEELASAGVKRERITLFNSTGTHRVNTPQELASMLGESVVRGYRIVQNDARARGAHRPVGVTQSGNEIRILSEFLECSFKIITGFIEPHFFAGFSGGAKAIMPGLAHLDSILRNHGACQIDDARASWGVLDGNPLREEIEEAVQLVKPDFLLNVALNRDKQVTRSFAGDWVRAYHAGTEFVRQTAMVKVPSLFDLVITSNSGYPLDLNLYQAVKGMSAAARITKPGGSIILAAECWDGIPEHGSFGALLAESSSPDELLGRIRSPGFSRDDQWQAQILARIVKEFDVHVYSSGLAPEELRRVHLHRCESIERTLGELIEARGKELSICVLPEGPQTIPYYERA